MFSLFINTLIICFGIFCFLLILSLFLFTFMFFKKKSPEKSSNDSKSLNYFLNNEDDQNFVAYILNCLNELKNGFTININENNYKMRKKKIHIELILDEGSNEMTDILFYMKNKFGEVSFSDFLLDCRKEYLSSLGLLLDLESSSLDIKSMIHIIQTRKIKDIFEEK